MKRAWIGVLLAIALLISGIPASASTAIEIIEQPSDIVAAIGETGAATVEAESAGEIAYQWYFKSVGSAVWEPSGMEGSTTDTIRVPVLQRRLGQQYKCVLTDEQGESVETDVVTVVNADRSEIVINAQPENICAKIGEAGTATVEVSVDTDAELNYQWYFKSVNSDAWQVSGMEGCKTATITVPVTRARLGQQYKCVITTEDGGRAETDAVEVTLPEPGEIVIDSQPENITAKLGENGTATVEASAEAELHYQWYFKTVGSDAWQVSGMEGCKTATITVPVTRARLGQQYKCVITAEDGGQIETEVVEVRQPDPAEIRVLNQPENIQAKLGETGTATVEAESDAALRYQWYYQSPGSNAWQASGMEGFNTATIAVPVTAARIGQRYKCVLTTDEGVSVETAEIEILEPEKSELTIVMQPFNVYAAIGDSATATVLVESDADVSYQWYFKTVNGTEWKPSGFEGCKTDTVTVPVTRARIGQQYKCVVTTADGVRVETRVVTVQEAPDFTLTVTQNPNSFVMLAGQPILLSASAKLELEENDREAYDVTYQWYRDGEAVEGADESELVIFSIEPEDAGSYYCEISAGDYVTGSRIGTVEVIELD